MDKILEEYASINAVVQKNNRWIFLHAPLIILEIEYEFTIEKKHYNGMEQICTLIKPSALFWNNGSNIEIHYRKADPTDNFIVRK